MRKEEILKRKVLETKLKEYFNKHPKSKSTIVHINFDGLNTTWKAEKLNEGFKIVEVTTKKHQYILSEKTLNELGPGEFDKMSPQQKIDALSKAEDFNYANALNAYLQITPTNNHDMMSKLLGSINKGYTERKKSFDAEMKNVGTLIGSLTGLVNDSARQGGPGGVPPREGKITEAEDDNKKIKPDEVGLEKNADLDKEPSDKEEPPPEDMNSVPFKKTGEEVQLQQMVQGKPVKSIDISKSDNDKSITLNLAGMKNPIEVHFDDNGKIFYKLGELEKIINPGAIDKKSTKNETY